MRALLSARAGVRRQRARSARVLVRPVLSAFAGLAAFALFVRQFSTPTVVASASIPGTWEILDDAATHLNSPVGVAEDHLHNLYVVDSANYHVYKLSPAARHLATACTRDSWPNRPRTGCAGGPRRRRPDCSGVSRHRRGFPTCQGSMHSPRPWSSRTAAQRARWRPDRRMPSARARPTPSQTLRVDVSRRPAPRAMPACAHRTPGTAHRQPPSRATPRSARTEIGR